MSTKPEALAAALGIGQAVPPKPKPGWCRGVGCGEKLDPILIDRPDGSGLHALCTELVEPARFAGRPSETEALELLRSKLGAQPIQTVPLPEPAEGWAAHDAEAARQAAGPCMDAWCAKNGRPCGFDVAAHITAHGPAILTDPTKGPITAQQVGTGVAVDRPDGGVEFRVTFHAPAPAEPEHAGANGACPDYGSRLDPCPPGCASGTCVHAAKAPMFSAPAPLEPESITVTVDNTKNTFTAPAGAHPLKAEMIKIIRWYDSSRPRSLQREIGMSEVGVDCLRRLAYSLAEVAPVNTAKDPWFAIVGTAVHAWLADALTAWSTSDEYGGPVFQVEQRVTATDGTVVVPGSTDFYRNALVGDHKIVGPDALKRTKDNGPSNQYRTQLHLNGLGWEQAGWPVDTVALLLYPRSGYLDGMHVWSEPYNRQVALDALARLSSVRAISTALGVGNVPASPDRAGCVWCPFYRPGADADATGCPGK